VPSLQSHGLRLILNVRKRLIDWEAPVERFRAMVARSARFFKPPGDVEIRPVVTDGVPGEWLIPPDASARSIILDLHGGGWTLGWSKIHRRMVAHLGRAAASRALVVDYRLAPEHPYPAALDDCLTAYRWLLRDGAEPRDIAIAGDSAGGNLTLATLLSLRDAAEPLPAAAVCPSPMTDLLGTGESFRTNKDPVLTAEFALMMARHYAGARDPRSPLLSPYYGDLHGLPPLLIHVGGDEVLLGDAERFADKARAAGVDVRLVAWPRMWPVRHFFAPSLPEARQAIEAIGGFIRERLAPASLP
jgi:monoterpene epsilon-lactone hydrolase